MSPTVRVAVTSDLHYDTQGGLTTPETAGLLAERIRKEDPDLVILAGDLAHGLSNYRKCLSCFSGLGVPLGVLAGNHDLWRDREAGFSSLALWREHLPKAVAEVGAVWLDRQNILMPPLAVVGSLAWYDYSALDPSIVLVPGEVADVKRLLSNDASWIDWGFSDRDFAGMLLRDFRLRLQQAASLAAISRILVVTHVPVLEGQIVRKPRDATWGTSNAFFGNLTAGNVILSEPKVQIVVSGHTHVGRKGVVERFNGPPVRFSVIPSEYGNPQYEVFDA